MSEKQRYDESVSSQGQLIDLEPNSEQNPQAVEKEESLEEYDESFVDKNGIMRSAEMPLVLLDKEAKVAIESYFDDHNKVAETIDKQIDDLDTVLTGRENYLAGKGIVGLTHKSFGYDGYRPNGWRDEQNLTKDQQEAANKELTSEVLSAFGLESTSDAISVEHGDNETATLDPEVQKLLDLVQQRSDKVKQIKDLQELLNRYVVSGISTESAKGLVADLPVETKELIEKRSIDTKLGLKGKISGDYREEFASKIHRAVGSIITEQQRSLDLIDKGMLEGATEQIIDIVREQFEQLDIGSHTSDTSSRLVRDELINHTQENLDQHGEKLGGIAEEVASIAEAQRAIQQQVGQGVLRDIFDQLSENQQDDLARSLFESLHKDDAIDPSQKERIGTLLGDTTFVAASVATRTLGEALHEVYGEEALPVSYMAQSEIDNLQRIQDKFDLTVNAVVERSSSGWTRRRVSHERGSDGFTIHGTAAERISDTVSNMKTYRADRVMVHATSFIKQIIESGSLMPLDKQKEHYDGAVHVTTGNIYDGGKRHSTVTHFATKLEAAEGYLGHTRTLEDGTELVSGVVSMAVGDIIQHAPVDRDGNLLAKLPLKSGLEEIGDNASEDNSDAHNDYTFYGVDERDDYELPLSEAEIFILGDQHVPIDIPAELSSKVHEGFASSQDVYLGKANLHEIEQAAKDYARQKHSGLVIPLRRILPDSDLEFSGLNRHHTGNSTQDHDLDGVQVISSRENL